MLLLDWFLFRFAFPIRVVKKYIDFECEPSQHTIRALNTKEIAHNLQRSI